MVHSHGPVSSISAATGFQNVWSNLDANPTGPKSMTSQRFRVKKRVLPREQLSGIMDERPKVDSAPRLLYQRRSIPPCRRKKEALIGTLSNHVTLSVRKSRALKR